MTALTLLFWYWFVLAVGLLALEIMTPTYFFFLWMAVAAALTGVLAWLIQGISSEIQVVIFSTLAVLAIVGWRMLGKKIPSVSDQPLLNQRGQQYIGRVFDLHEAIENGEGKIKVDDSIWKVRGADCDINSKVKVIASHGTVFDVEKVS